jgi:hypothetical protein
MVFRCDETNNAASLPAPPSAGTEGYFQPPNPGSGTTPVIVRAWWLNMVQEELRAIAVAGGQVPSKTNNAQVLAALNALYAPLSGARVKLNSPLSLYVNQSTGNDTNAGTSLSPFKTLQHAANVVMQSLDLNGQTVVINFAHGTDTGGVTFRDMPLGCGSGGGVQFVGDTSSPGSCIVSVTGGNCFVAGAGTTISISGFHLAATAGGSGITGCGLVGNQASSISFDHCEFDACATAHMYATSGAIIQSNGAPYAITGDSAPTPEHILVSGGGGVSVAGSTVTIGSARAFTDFVASALNSWVIANGMTFSGAGVAGTTGARYSVVKNGVVDTNGGGATYFPGNSGGSTASGGQYL